jgi:hypothetical protein
VEPFHGLGGETSPDRVERQLCGLVSALPDRVGEMCVRGANLHLLVRHREHGSVHGLLSCSDHYLTAVQAGELIVDHPIGYLCGQPGTYFDQEHNICRQWDEGS